ncbi:MAG: Nre family DNA repair protein [Nitrososphaerota archaeon]|nr:Nre family DNA repair protein [Nitrososphaerota archaeon]
MNNPQVFWGNENIELRAIRGSQCIYCLGSRALCGRRQCPILFRYSKLQPALRLENKTMLDGSSPPGVFVGRIGYPKIGVGPMIPPYFGNTRILDYPESWWSIDLEKLVEYRSSLVRGVFKVNAYKPCEAGRLFQLTQEIAMASQPTEAYVEFSKPIRARILLDEDAQPFGPSGIVEKIESGNIKVNRFIEKAYYDEDLKASEAIYYLYSLGVPVSTIQKAFSIAIFGIGKRRRLVPTRWSITAVDSTLAQKMLEKIKENPEVDEYAVYESEHIDNRFIVIVIPGKWSYEFIEMFHPGSVWNIGDDGSIALGSDYEDVEGRTTYAKIGGCYYAARFAIVEHLFRTRRQGSVLVLREAGPGYFMPAGVWLVRENVRKALRGKPVKFGSLEDAFTYVARRLRTPWQLILKESWLLRSIRERRRITEYLKEKQDFKHAYDST